MIGEHLGQLPLIAPSQRFEMRVFALMENSNRCFAPTLPGAT